MANTYAIINGSRPPQEAVVGDRVYKTGCAGQAVDLICSICADDPEAEFHIYGGDGSVFEAVNALMAAQCAKARLVIHPFGTGNDFSRNFSADSVGMWKQIDLISFNDSFAANEVNVGFDCDVVMRTEKIKKFPLFHGSIAYTVSAFLGLFKRLGKKMNITYVDENGEVGQINRKLFLCVVANGGYYGGGYRCAPLAQLDDGFLDLIYVDVISRFRFISFFLKYRKGKHILPDGTVSRNFRKILQYRRVRSVTFDGIGDFCADGEIFHTDMLSVSVLPKAVTVRVERKKEKSNKTDRSLPSKQG